MTSVRFIVSLTWCEAARRAALEHLGVVEYCSQCGAEVPDGAEVFLRLQPVGLYCSRACLDVSWNAFPVREFTA